MVAAIEKARADGDSVGGVVEVRAAGLPAGLGAPFFDRVETRLGAMLLSLPAVRGIEFGDGFACARRRGSENNDRPTPSPDGDPARIGRATNRAGGAEGGITTGLPVVARLAFKPTPSIPREQTTVDLGTNEAVPLRVPGRHDPCVVPRAVPLVESAAAFALYDLLLSSAAAR
jgi:chorismate synthase